MIDIDVDEEFIPDVSRKEAKIQLVTVKGRLQEIGGEKSRLNDLYIRGKLPPVKYETYTMEFEQEETELQDKLRKLENTLAEINLTADAIDKAVEIITQQVAYLGKVKIPRALLEENNNSIGGVQEFMDHIKGRNMAKMEGITDLEDVRGLIFQQKRQIIQKFILAGGKIRLYKDRSLAEVEGPLPDSFNLEALGFNPLGRDHLP